ncbi:MAG: hypothetical protein WAL85_19200 [Candidatus Korobacteraceae bacterium]
MQTGRRGVSEHCTAFVQTTFFLAATDTSTKKNSRQRNFCGCLPGFVGAIDFVKVKRQKYFSDCCTRGAGLSSASQTHHQSRIIHHLNAGGDQRLVTYLRCVAISRCRPYDQSNNFGG